MTFERDVLLAAAFFLASSVQRAATRVFTAFDRIAYDLWGDPVTLASRMQHGRMATWLADASSRRGG